MGPNQHQNGGTEWGGLRSRLPAPSLLLRGCSRTLAFRLQQKRRYQPVRFNDKQTMLLSRSIRGRPRPLSSLRRSSSENIQRQPSTETICSDVSEDATCALPCAPLSLTASESSSPSLSPSLSSAMSAASLDGDDASLSALTRLNSALLQELRREREHRQALQASMKADCRSLDANNNNNSSNGAAVAEPPASVPAVSETRAHPLARLSASSSRGNGKLTRRGSTKRSRVVVNPLSAGQTVVANHSKPSPPPPLPPPVVVTSNEAAPEAASSWPEPASSPPCKPQRRPRWPREGELKPTFSAALTDHVRQAVAEELQRLQEQLQALLTESPPPEPKAYGEAIRSLARRLGWLRSDLNALQAHATGSELAAEGAAALGSLYELAESAEEFARSLRAELLADDRVEAEQKHAQKLCEASGLTISQIARDGNCLFACAQKWIEQRAEPASDGELEAAAQSSSSAAAAERSLAALMCSSASEVRALVVDTLGEWSSTSSEGANGAGSVAGSVAARMSEAVGAAVRGGASDATSLALRESFNGDSTSGGTTGALSDVGACRRAYLQVMGRVGIYGERLEIEALAALVRAPVHIYYMSAPVPSGAEASPSVEPVEPSEVITPEGGVGASAEPLRLLHLINSRHFELLLSGSVTI